MTDRITYHSRWKHTRCGELLYQSPIGEKPSERGGKVARALRLHRCEKK